MHARVMDELPRHLTSAEARRSGVTRATLTASGLVRTHHGLWVADLPTTLDEAIAQAGAVIRCPWAVCGWSAVELLGLPDRRPWQPGDPVHVCVPTAAGRVRREGIVSRKGLERRRVVDVSGIPVVAGIWAVADVLTDPLATHEDLVRLCDGYLHLGGTAGSLVAPASLGRRGASRLRGALRDTRHGAESPRETDLRLLLAQAGLPEPEQQVRLVDADGATVCRFDLYWEEFALGGEFDGDGHRTQRGRWRGDRRADRRALLLGHRRLRVTSDDVMPDRRHETVEEFRTSMVPVRVPVRGRLVRTVDSSPLVLPW